MRKELDLKKAESMLQDIQRYLAKQAYLVDVIPGFDQPYALHWPVVRNWGVERGGKAYTSYWLDTLQPPLKKG